MLQLQPKINKLLKALETIGEIYLVNNEQFYSDNLGKVGTVIKLYHLISAEEYNEKYPNNKVDVNKYDKVKDEVFKTYKKQDLLLYLVELYKGVNNG